MPTKKVVFFENWQRNRLFVEFDFVNLVIKTYDTLYWCLQTTSNYRLKYKSVEVNAT